MSGGSPRLAVIIPAYNEEQMLPRCLQTLRNQDYRGALEIIVVDNDSTDQTASIASLTADTVVRCADRGRLNSIRRGLLTTTAEVVAFADADTEYPSTWARRLREAFVDDRVQLVFGPSTQGLRPGIALNALLKCYKLWVHASLARGIVCSVGFNMAVRRTAAARVISPLKSVALNDWALGTAIYDTYSRPSIKYIDDLIVPKCMRRYERDGWWRTTALPMREWLRFVVGGNLTVSEREYHGF